MDIKYILDVIQDTIAKVGTRNYLLKSRIRNYVQGQEAPWSSDHHISCYLDGEPVDHLAPPFLHDHIQKRDS